MVNNQWKNRFEEVVCEANGIESPNSIRKKHLASIVLNQLEEEMMSPLCATQEYGGFSFDEELFRVIFEDLKFNKCT